MIIDEAVDSNCLSGGSKSRLYTRLPARNALTRGPPLPVVLPILCLTCFTRKSGVLHNKGPTHFLPIYLSPTRKISHTGPTSRFPRQARGRPPWSPGASWGLLGLPGASWGFLGPPGASWDPSRRGAEPESRPRALWAGFLGFGPPSEKCSRMALASWFGASLGQISPRGPLEALQSPPGRRV